MSSPDIMDERENRRHMAPPRVPKWRAKADEDGHFSFAVPL